MEPELQPRASYCRRHLLSPAELLTARTRDRKVPQRSHGQKDFIPDGSEAQEERLLQCREEHWQLLAEERVERLGSLVKAEWKPRESIVELKSPAGKFWHTMGFTEHGKQCLLPEEALYLLECGSIQLFYKDLPLSIQEAYENLLSQKSFSLLKYQVFSHLKRLGYIVMRFQSSTVPTSYERQLNLSTSYQSREKGRCKRRRSSSPRLQDKKPKASEKSQECKESPKRSRSSHESSSYPALADLSRETTEESNIGMTIEEPVSSSSATVQHSELSACSRDFKERSIKPSWESHNDIRPSRWDFATIAFPNMGADCPQTLLPKPDERLLPSNITAREVDASSWRKQLNQKQDKLSRKEREQLEWESRYKSSINEDKEVRCCSTWQEYKALLKERRRWKERNFPAHLWEQAVTPLVKPEQGLSTADTLQQISVLQPSHILDESSQFCLSAVRVTLLFDSDTSEDITWQYPFQAIILMIHLFNRLQKNSKDMKIDFDVYQADAASSFKKNDPGKPYVRMCVRRFDEQIPSLRALKQLAFQSGDIPVVFALVDNGDISFYSFKEFKLPIDIYS